MEYKSMLLFLLVYLIWKQIIQPNTVYTNFAEEEVVVQSALGLAAFDLQIDAIQLNFVPDLLQPVSFRLVKCPSKKLV